MQKQPVSSWVYVIAPACGIPCKIGLAVDPAARLAQLQCGSPVMLTLWHSVHYIGDARRLEAVAHGVLERYRSHGEWFSVMPADALAAIIRAGNLLGLDAE